MVNKNTEQEPNNVFLSLDIRLAKEAIPSILDQLSPSIDVSAEAAGSAQEHWKQTMRDVAARLVGVRRLLAKIYARLSEQSASRFERARKPDPDEQNAEILIDEALKLEERSRMAQKALQAWAKGIQRECDTAFQSAELRLEKAIQLTPDELVSPTARTSTEGAVCDQEQWSPEVITLLDEMLLLKEIERHRRLLCEKPTWVFDLRNVPEIYFIEPIGDSATQEALKT